LVVAAVVSAMVVVTVMVVVAAAAAAAGAAAAEEGAAAAAAAGYVSRLLRKERAALAEESGMLYAQLAARGVLLAEREEALQTAEADLLQAAEQRAQRQRALVARWGLASARRRLLAMCLRAFCLHAAASRRANCRVVARVSVAALHALNMSATLLNLTARAPLAGCSPTGDASARCCRRRPPPRGLHPPAERLGVWWSVTWSVAWTMVADVLSRAC
jgi:hypothetical protein